MDYIVWMEGLNFKNKLEVVREYGTGVVDSNYARHLKETIQVFTKDLKQQRSDREHTQRRKISLLKYDDVIYLRYEKLYQYMLCCVCIHITYLY